MCVDIYLFYGNILYVYIQGKSLCDIFTLIYIYLSLSTKCGKWQLNHNFTLFFKTNKLKYLLSLLKKWTDLKGTCFTFIYASSELETELRSHFGQTQNAINYNISSSHYYF